MSSHFSLPGKSDLTISGRAPVAPSGVVYLEPLTTVASPDGSSDGIFEYLRLIRGRKLLIGILAILGAAAGCAISFLQIPLYEARSYLEFQNIKSGDAVIGLKDSEFGGFSPETYLQTQVKVLQSRSLRKRVQEKLKNEYPKGANATPNRVTAWRKALGLSVPSSTGTTGVLTQVHARIVDSSRIIEILCESTDPQFAAKFANTMSNEYIEYSLESLWESAKRNEDWLMRQLEQLKKELERSEDQLQAYSQQTGLVFTGAEERIDDEKLKQLQAELSAAQADRIAKQSLHEMSTSTREDSVPQVVDNGRLSEYQSKLTELRQELADLSSLFTSSHYKVARVQARITALEATITKERQNILTRIENEYKAALRREGLLTAAYVQQLQIVSETGRKAIYYNISKREVDSNRQLYDQLLQKAKQVGIGSASQASNIRVLDPAEPPALPSKPDLIRNAGIGILSGLLLAIGFVMGGELIDHSVRSPGESPFHLKVPELGVIPSDNSFCVPPERRGLAPLVLRNGADGGGRFELATWQDRPSPLAESFRSTLASIILRRSGLSDPLVLMITSAGRGEGKSSIVSNLGIALAEINHKVLLVDADMRKPHQHDIFNVPNTWGLSDLLREKSSLASCPLEALARKTEIEGLYILPSGPGTVSIANLLYSIRMSELIQRLRKEFHIVIVDTPPMRYVSDARVLGRLADGAILVLRAGQTTRDAARAAKQRLVDDGIPVLGTILNGWDSKSKTRYGYNGYYA